MKNGVNFIVVTLLLDDFWPYNVDKKSCIITVSEDFFCMELKLCTVVTLIAKFHNMFTVTFPREHNEPQALSFRKVKLEFSSLKKCYLLLMFIQWVWGNMDITPHKHKKVHKTWEQQRRHYSF